MPASQFVQQLNALLAQLPHDDSGLGPSHPKAGRGSSAANQAARSKRRLCLAVSAGPDSTALAQLWHRNYRHFESRVDVFLGHVHHHLRAEESDRDLEACRLLAERLRLPLIVAHRRVDTVRARDGGSVETVARDLRLDAFGEWSLRYGIEAVITAHHADDQAETVLDRVLRGTGIRGLGGMLSVRPLSPPATGQLWRPLLSTSRSDLRTFLEREGVSARADDSNQDWRHQRNRIRHELLPLLETYNPQVSRHLNALAKDARAARDDLDHRTVVALEAVQFGRNCARVATAVLDRWSSIERQVLAGPLLDRIWERLSGQTLGLNRDQIEHWIDALQPQGPAAYDLPHGWIVERAGPWVAIFPRALTIDLEADAAARRIPLSEREPTPVTWADAVLLPHTELTPPHTSPWSWGPSWDPTEDSAIDLCVRPARPTDRLEMDGWHASVTELLRSAGIPRSLRGRFPVVVDRNQDIALWLPGVRASARTGPARFSFEPQSDSDLARLLFSTIPASILAQKNSSER